MSTHLSNFVTYMGNWEYESDENIDSVICELESFAKLEDFECGTAIDEEFQKLTTLLNIAEAERIGTDILHGIADVSLLYSIWDMAFGMGVYVVSTLGQLAVKYTATEFTDLRNKLARADIDIASNINEDVKTYIEKYKQNNRLIRARAAEGMDGRQCRLILMEFMAYLQKKGQTVTVPIFKKYAASIKRISTSNEIKDVYNALDNLNLGVKSQIDVDELMKTLKGLKLPFLAMGAKGMIQNIALRIVAWRMDISQKTIAERAQEAGITEECEPSSFEMMDAVGWFAFGVAAALTAVDVVLEIMDGITFAKQCNAMRAELQGRIKESYSSFFLNIQKSSKLYNKAIAANGTEKEIDANVTKKANTAFRTEAVLASADKSRCCVVL